MNKKSSFCFLLLLLLARTSIAQLGIGTTTPDPSAQLEIRSTSKGLLIPRIASTANVPTAIIPQSHQATGSGTSFTLISGATVSLSTTLMGTVPINATGSGVASGLAIPVTAGTRLLLSLSVPNDSAITLSGYVSEGVTINEISL